MAWLGIGSPTLTGWDLVLVVVDMALRLRAVSVAFAFYIGHSGAAGGIVRPEWQSTHTATVCP